MEDITIHEYVGNLRELTAKEVRSLPVGTKVLRHSFDLHGNYVQTEMTVAQNGREKVLATRDYIRGKRVERTIWEVTDRMCYTETGSSNLEELEENR